MTSARKQLKRMNRERNFMRNTCPASRHVAMCAEGLIKRHEFHLCTEDPEHIGDSIASAVESLWNARSFLRSLGYTWRHDKKGRIIWVKFEDLPPDDPERQGGDET